MTGSRVGPGTDKQCDKCAFFNWPAVDEKWTGLCERFPVHARVNTHHGCAEFRPPVGGVPKPDPRSLSARAARETRENALGNFLLELTPVEAVVVGAALRLAIEHGFVFDESKGASLLSRVADRLPPSWKP